MRDARVVAAVYLNLISRGRRVSEAKSFRYAANLLAGATFPPVRLFWDASRQLFRISDGGHRVAAHRLAGRRKILATFSLKSFSSRKGEQHGRRKDHL